MRHGTMLSFVLLFAIGAGLAAQSDAKLLSLVDAQASFLDSDFSARYRMSVYKPGAQVTVQVADVYRRDRDEVYTIILQEPKQDAGKGFISRKGIVELYDPVSRAFTRTSPGERFQNSNARNSDFTRSWYARDYRLTGTEAGKLGIYNCKILALEAKVSGVPVPLVKLWIDENNRVLKKVDSSKSGLVMEITAIPEYQQVGRRWIPKKIVIENRLSFATVGNERVYEKTIMTISDPSLKGQPDLNFSKAVLEKESR